MIFYTSETKNIIIKLTHPGDTYFDVSPNKDGPAQSKESIHQSHFDTTSISLDPHG